MTFQRKGACLGFIFAVLSAALAHAQYTENVLYNFGGSPDGSEPYYVQLVFDAQGNLYGTTSINGAHNGGAVFKLTPPAGGVGAWSETLIYSFCGASNCADGSGPMASVVLDQQGNIYGTTNGGGAASAGEVFELTPQTGSCPAGSFTGAGYCAAVIYSFCSVPGCSDGQNPQSGLIFDAAGNLYGTTTGGANGGVVFQLTPPAGGSGSWTETVISTNCANGCFGSGLTFDAAGNLFATTGIGGPYGHGSVFELSQNSGGNCPGGGTPMNGWCQNILYNFCAQAHCVDGAGPTNSAVVFDSSGNLYGTTVIGGSGPGPGNGGSGSVFQLSPTPAGGCPSGSYPGNGWCDTVLHSFGNSGDGATPSAGVILDAAGNLYGTTLYGGFKNLGTVYKLSPPAGGTGSWTQTQVFGMPGTNGAYPQGGLVFGPDGNLYGTTYWGGPAIKGNVFQIVGPPVPTVGVASSLDPSGYGQSVSFTATVTANPSSTASPTGTVQFQIDGSNFGAPVAVASGTATSSSTTAISSGPHIVTAFYSGDQFNGTASGSVTQTVQQVGSTVTVSLTGGSNPSAYGNGVTFTATVTGSNGQIAKRNRIQPHDVTGTVTWSDNTGCGTTAVVAGTATCTVSALPVGAATITATYNGDSNHTGGTGSLGQTVNQQTPSLAITFVNPSGISYGQNVGASVTATLTWTGSGNPPAGALTLGSNAAGSFSGSPDCNINGTTMTCVQTFNVKATGAPGSYTFSASYAGDANYTAAATPPGTNFTISQQTPTAGITVSPASEAYAAGTAVTVSATLAWTGLGAKPTSAGTLLNFASTAQGSFGTVTCTGSASPIRCKTQFTPVATDAAASYTISANYAGDAHYTPAASSGVNNFHITADAPAAAVTPNPVAVKQGSTTPVTITAAFTGAGAQDAAPSGAVTFSAATGTFTNKSCTASGDVLTCTVSYRPTGKLASGTYTNYITATMAASGDYKAATGHASLTVTP